MENNNNGNNNKKKEERKSTCASRLRESHSPLGIWFDLHSGKQCSSNERMYERTYIEAGLNKARASQDRRRGP